jgi:sulfotransferase
MGEIIGKANLHFISGLPRAGSTLVAAILRQNPKFHAAMSSPLGFLYLSMLEAVSEKNESALFIPREKKPELLRSIFEVYYKEKFAAGQIVFDTSRLWCAKLAGLTQLFPQSRVFCSVRNLAWILDSLERHIRKNPFELSKIFDLERSDTLDSRIEFVLRGVNLVGFAWNALREAFFGEQADRLVLIQYESLVRDPEKVMNQFYDLLGEPRFRHDFDNLSYDEPEFDARLGMPGLHKVKAKVHHEPRGTILPPDIFKRYENWAFWTDPSFNTRNVTIW